MPVLPWDHNCGSSVRASGWVGSLALKERLSTARESSPGLWEFDVTLDIPSLLLNLLGVGAGGDISWRKEDFKRLLWSLHRETTWVSVTRGKISIEGCYGLNVCVAAKIHVGDWTSNKIVFGNTAFMGGKIRVVEVIIGTSLVVQWLRLHTPSEEWPGSVYGQGTRSEVPQLRVHMPQLKMLHATTSNPMQANK